MARLKLVDLAKPPEPVEFPDGSEHVVLSLNGFAADVYTEMANGGETDVRALWRIAGLVVPSATEDQIKRLDASQVAAVLAVASGNVEKVLAEVKRTAGTAEAPDPAAPSGPSVSPSAATTDGGSAT